MQIQLNTTTQQFIEAQRQEINYHQHCIQEANRKLQDMLAILGLQSINISAPVGVVPDPPTAPVKPTPAEEKSYDEAPKQA